jgi:hypothetical protein
VLAAVLNATYPDVENVNQMSPGFPPKTPHTPACRRQARAACGHPARVGRQWRNFGCAGSESRTVGANRDGDSFALQANSRVGIGYIVVTVFEPKKEIPP